MASGGKRPRKRQTLKELFAEWRADYAAREAEEKLRREGKQPEQQQQTEQKKDRDRDYGR